MRCFLKWSLTCVTLCTWMRHIAKSKVNHRPTTVLSHGSRSHFGISQKQNRHLLHLQLLHPCLALYAFILCTNTQRALNGSKSRTCCYLFTLTKLVKVYNTIWTRQCPKSCSLGLCHFCLRQIVINQLQTILSNWYVWNWSRLTERQQSHIMSAKYIRWGWHQDVSIRRQYL